MFKEGDRVKLNKNSFVPLYKYIPEVQDSIKKIELIE